MVRETRHLWVGNLPENIREERIREHFKRYGRVQSVKLLPRCTEEKTGEITMACTVAFMDIKSASKAHNAELKIDDRTLNTEYYEPAAIPSATASPQNTPSPYSTSPGSTRFPNGHGSTDDHVTIPFTDRFYDRTTSSSRLAGSSGGSTGTSGVGGSDSAEFLGSGRGTTRGSSTTTSTSASSTYHGDAVSAGGGRSSSSSSSSAAPAATTTGRSRERIGAYRNGPYGSNTTANATSLDGRNTSRISTTSNSWGYESTRYNSTGNNQSDTGYSTTTPTENIERRTSDQIPKKKAKSKSGSQAGSRSPSPTGSTSSRSPSRSRSRSSSSSTSSSMSRDTSSTSSPKSKRLTSSNTSNSNHQPVVHSDDRRPLAICVKNLPVRSSDTSLKDGLFHEYKKHGKVTWVKVVGKDAERHAIVCFKKPEDVEKALEVSYDKLFFGCKIEVAPYQGYDVEDNDLRPYEAEIDEYHPKATRTLFIGNLEKDVTASDLRKHFDQFGEIIEIDIKKQGAVSSYAFCQYSDIVSVVKAIRKMDGEHLGSNRIKLGFGKSMPYNCVWIDGINENVNDKYLKMQFEPFGVISKLHIDREKGQALIFYDQVMSAQTAVAKMRGFTLKNTKIQVDFASRECQESFFERLEKQGTILDRTVFEERREPIARTFEATPARFARYETPTRPRTSSYSSRSNASVSQVTSLQSPGTPGSVTPRGTSSRSRARFADYYDQTLDYADRHFRSYDEYSQSSTASHEDLYDHEYGFIHEAGDPLQVIDNVVPFAPPDMRNLQKERVHLLEQLEECPSSGDELISPKKRMKIDLLDTVITSDVIIEANRDHRKVMEVRRLSDVNLKHHSRRPSIDSGKHVRHEVIYVPRSVCKRRKTAGSDNGSKVQQYDHSGSESVGGSRPGTPLCDERPENIQPSEPRRVPREREGPLTLPLPRFAAQIMNKGSISIAGIKGQKDNILSSPPPAVTSPRISNPRPPSPVHVPPPASPPPRPPSLSSNSSDGDITPPSPSLEERIKSLDERYEKWSGSRAVSAAGGDALALLDANLEKFRQRHKILDLDLKEVQPSEIVKSVMAKRSVFDEDLKRLENVGEKYEPKEFSFFPRSTLTTQTTVPTMPLSTPPVLKLSTVPAVPKTPTLLSPRSAGTGMPAAKGLQYPFPTHPPILMSPSIVSTHSQTPTTTTTTVSAQLPLQTATTTTTTPTSVSVSVLTTATTTTTMPSATTAPPRGASHGDNRLKPCSSAPSDTRTSSKMIVNKTNVVSAVKISEKTNVNIPNASDGKFVRDKSGDKISCRRDSGSSSNSPRSDIKTRRNSDTSARRSDDSDAEQAHKERAQSEERKRERMEKIKVENEKLEKEKSERERLERERHEHEKQEKLRLEKERLEKERLERESELEKQRLEKERLEKEKLEKEQQEQQRLKLERERIEKENLEKIQKEKEKQEHERLERERLEKERKEKEEIERRLREEQEKQRIEKEKHEKEKKEREELERTERKYREEKERRNDDSEKDNKHDREREKIRHKDDNHDKRKDDHRHHHSDNKHKENHLDKLIEHKHTKDSSSKDDKLASKDSNQISTHDSRSSYDKNKMHLDRDSDRRKESIKENRDNNIHEKHKHISDNRIRDIVETRHMSIDLDKVKSSHEKHDPSKRKERNNSLPASIGSKRRFSSQETVEMCEDSKKIKLSHDSKKISERRDSKDSTRSEDRIKTSKHKNNIHKSHDKFNSSKDSEEKRKEREERHKKHKLDKQKSKSKSREKESHDSSTLTLPDKEFLTKLELKSNEDKDKHKLKESKEKRTNTEEHERIKKLSIEKSTERPQLPHEKIPKIPLDSESSMRSIEEKKKRDRIRKLVNSSDSDSDEPKKHSIFDIVDDEPAYISMYDKVKARSCKNMAKLEEEKRQEKVKAKFNQLKQSRAKREEKKRSTSWDEDSDSDKDHCEIRIKRCPKVLDSSDDESQERRPRKIYSDSDSSTIFKNVKHELIDTSDDESRNKTIILKSIKSRITSDTSEDEQTKPKIELHIKQEFPETTTNPTTTTTTEIQSYNMDIPDDKSHLFKVKDEINKVKKERRNSKHQETEIPNSTFSDTSQSEIKLEKFNTKHFVDITTDEELHEVSKKERSERREKKHKKKQKKQKHSVSSEESGKFENISDCTHSENQEKPKHDKKKEHNKKEKRRDKNREGRDKSKKSRKNKLDNKSDSKRDGKMENIFGSLSEDSENGTKELEQEPKFEEEPAVVVNPPVYNSESEKEHENKTKDKLEREREKEEHKRKKEKKRRDKERRLQEVAAAAASLAVANEQGSNDNSMDYIDMGKQLEANMMMQDDDLNLNKTVETNFETTDDTFNFETNETKKEKEEKRENKEKKKKRKKSKDEKNKHHNHHHHHHHDKNKIKSPENKTETPRVESSSEPIISTPTQPQNPSLPSIIDEQSPVNSKTLTPEYSPINPIISPIPKTPTTQDKKREKLIPGFGSEIDDKVHESAVKSISEFQAPVNKEEQPTAGTEEADNKPAQGQEEKPRAVISQEETEDAVAALLGESFGSVKQEEFYNDNNSIEEPTNSLVENANVQDDEEMRQAVQSLSAADLDIKPDTPQSEHDLQIDTDTEEQEDVPVRFDSAPKTPEIVEFPQLPKTPDLPPFFANSIDEKQTALKSTPNINSPPSLTPIRSSPSNAEARKSVDVEKTVPTESQQQRTVISKSWNTDKKLDVPISKPQPSVIQIETKKVTTSVSEPSMQITTVASKPFTSPPVLKIAEPQYPPLKPLSKPDHANLSPDLTKIQTIPVVQTPTKSSTPPQLHNLPARSPIQMNKPPIDTGLLSPRLPPGLIHNRMPITSVMVSKPMQATTVILQQSKVATTIEPPKLVSTSEPRSQERPRMIFQSSSIQPPQFTNFNSNQPRMIQGNIRHLPPPGLLVPARQFNYLAGVPHPTFNVSSNLHETNTENLPDSHAKIPQGLPSHLNTTHTPLTHLSIPKETVGNKPPTPTLVSPKSTTDSPSSGPFSPMCGSPQVKNSTSPEPTLATMSPKPMPIGSPKPTSEISQQFLLQSTTKNTEPPRVPTPKSEQRMIFQPSNMQSPHYGNFNMNPSRIMMPGNIRHLPSSGLLVPARHPFNYLPHSTYNIHENSTENVSDCQSKISPPTQPTSMLPSPKASTNSSITTPFSSASISPQFKNSSSPIQTQVVMSPKPIENPKLIPTESPAVSVATTEFTGNVPEQSVPTSEINSSISIHSPVIVSTTSTNEPQKNEPVIKEQEKPIKLAIEAVTDELNISLGKPSPEIPPEVKSEPTEIKSEIKDEPKLESQPDHQDLINKENIEEKTPTVVVEKDITTDVKEIEKFDEEKTETESIVSDISKERSISADILAKDDPLDTKEDSDYWSAKEVNIDSVIKTLCSADELSDHSSENGKTEWFDDQKSDEPKLQTTNPTVYDKSLSPLKKQEETPDSNEPRSDESELLNDSIEPESTEDETKDPPILRSSSRRGGRGRGRGKNQPIRGAISTTGGIQTRRGKLKEQSQPNPPVAKRGRGAKTRNERKSSKTEFESAPADIYEFRDEPDDSNKEQRPRLILTIKSPAVLNSNNAQTTATVKEVTKDGAKEIGKEQPKETHCAVISKTPEHKSDEFASPSTNTRKSRRLLERDTSKNTVDDTIEDVIKNTVQAKGLANQRRSGRQANPKQSPPQPETPRKSPRGRKGRRGSEAAENSSSEETVKEEIKVISPLQIKSIEKPKEIENQKDTEHPIEKTPEPVLKEKPMEGLKATVLRRIKGEMNLQNSNEPTNLIDPVTGELIPMRESEEGKYIPLPGTNNVALHKKPEDLPNKELSLAPNANEPEQSKLLEVVKPQPSVIAQPQQITVVQQPKPHTLKAHVLSSQAAQAVTQQVSVPQTKVTTSTVVVSSKSTSEEIVVPKQTPPIVITKSITPIVVSKTVTPVVVTKPVTPVVVSKPVTPISQHLTVNTNLGVSSPHLSPRANVSTKPLPKQSVKTPALSPGLIPSQQKQQVQQMLATKQPQVPKTHITQSIMNTQLAHMKHQPMIKQQVILGKSPIVKQLPPQQILSAAIPSPPLSKSQSTLNNPARIIQPASSVGGKGIMDPPKVEVTMNNVMLGQRPKLSPQGPQQRIVGQTGLPLPGYEPSLGEAIAHFPPGQLRPPPDLNPHYMHPSHMIQYQQYLRQQQLQHFSRTGCIEKLGDGQEGEEAPVTSPPLELRRGRGTGVPHSLHSPHDRTTDSPQIGQVYNVHSTARIPYHHPSRYYDQAEPPPAHRPLTSHGSLAALGSDRGLAHIGTPDRPLSGHSALSAHMGGLGPADRPLSTHIDRPLSAHGFMGAGLGAAGNLMGAVARHIGADAPTTQRGLQAATPPHASQVPPQAESLLMLLKQYPCMWQGLLALKNDQAAVQMYFVSGNDAVAKCSLPKNTDGSTPPLRIFQRMRLEPPQVEGVARKMQMENEHCMLLALPCGHDHMDVLKQSTNLTSGFITYLQQKQAAGIVNVAAPGTTQPAAYVVHIFPSCDFVNENLRRIAPSLLERVADIAHLLIVITTV